MNKRLITEWQRIEYDNTPIYIRPDAPNWFVPNQAADKALEKWLRHKKSPYELENLLKRIDGPVKTEYQSRSDQLRIDSLKECWLHITNRCNMECKHCLFKSSPNAHDEMTQDDCDRIIHESYELGCRLFFFTGGEPLIPKAFFKSVEDILQFSNTHFVVLTNLSLISQTRDQFRSLPQVRLHFQVSLDGLQSNHDALRGPHAFHRLSKNLMTLRKLGFPVTLSTTVTRHNVDEMEGIIDFAAQQQLFNVHFLCLFKKGNADDSLLAEPDRIFLRLTAAQERAETVGGQN
jgi:MoaA/NifB/PqqE/SkfB family radical SAM enzyme